MVQEPAPVKGGEAGGRVILQRHPELLALRLFGESGWRRHVGRPSGKRLRLRGYAER